MNTTFKRLLRLFQPVLILLASQMTTAQEPPLKMKMAIELALANNYSLKADSMNLAMPDISHKILKADFLPQINYAGKAEYNPAIATQLLPGNVAGQPGKEYVPVQFGTSYFFGSGIEVKQNLFNKSTRIQLGALGLNKAIAQSKHNLTREQLVYEVSKTFYGLQASAQLIKTTAHDYQNLKAILAIAQAQFENGLLKKIDLESLEITTANKQAYLNQLQTQYKDQLVQFNYLVGLPSGSRTMIDEQIVQANPVEIGELSLNKREDIHLYHQLIQSKEVELKSIRAERLPVVSSYFRFNYQSQFNDLNHALENDYRYKTSTIGITASIQLFDGYRRKNRISLAKAEMDQLKYQQQNQELEAQMEWVSANETLRNNQFQYKVTRQNLEKAEKVFNSRSALYSEGVSTLIELLDAERELTQSRNLQIQALIDVQTSLLDVYKAKGTLLSEFLQSL